MRALFSKFHKNSVSLIRQILGGNVSLLVIQDADYDCTMHYYCLEPIYQISYSGIPSAQTKNIGRTISVQYGQSYAYVSVHGQAAEVFNGKA